MSLHYLLWRNAQRYFLREHFSLKNTKKYTKFNKNVVKNYYKITIITLTENQIYSKIKFEL